MKSTYYVRYFDQTTITIDVKNVLPQSVARHVLVVNDSPDYIFLSVNHGQAITVPPLGTIQLDDIAVSNVRIDTPTPNGTSYVMIW